MAAIRPTLAIVRLAALIVLLAGAAIALVAMGTDGVRDLLDDAADSRLGLLAFFAVYVVAIVLLLPGTVGTVASGAILGFGVGFPMAIAAQTVGATICHLIARLLGREGTRQLVGNRLDAADEWLRGNSFVTILILRMTPIMPFNVLNYGSGIAAIRLSRYLPATVLGLLPGSAVTTLAASRADDPTDRVFLLAAFAIGVSVLISSLVARRMVKRRLGRDE